MRRAVQSACLICRSMEMDDLQSGMKARIVAKR